jgi:hypothetical protein
MNICHGVTWRQRETGRKSIADILVRASQIFEPAAIRDSLGMLCYPILVPL